MMMLMMPFMLLFWVALIVGVALLVRWLTNGGDSTSALGRMLGSRRRAGLSAGATGEPSLLPDDSIERDVFQAHRRIEELQEQLSWQGRLLAAEADDARVERGRGRDGEVDAAPGGFRSGRPAAQLRGAPSASGRRSRRRAE